MSHFYLKTNTNIDSKIEFGFDANTEHVQYDANIADNDKIIGLAEFIENKYFLFKNFFERENMIIGDIPKVQIKLSNEIFEDEEIKISKEPTNGNQPIKNIFTRLGEYCPSNDVSKSSIKIYYKAFDMSNILKFEASIIQCLAHECFHYIHHSYIKEQFNDLSKNSKIVKESLADFYSLIILLFYYYAVIRGKGGNELKLLSGIKGADGAPCFEEIAKERYDFWKRYDYDESVYSYALKILTLDNKEYEYSDDLKYYDSEEHDFCEKFTRVFQESKDSFDNAIYFLKTI